MNGYDAAPVLAGLKDFQRATVEHVIRRLYTDATATRRFLVADETGLGKSVVARGVIARALEHLQHDDTVQRIDVVYVCSNADIAAQNIARLRVTDDECLTLNSRLTLLAKHSKTLDTAHSATGKPLNLVAFTPGTSFDPGQSQGTAEERALLYLLLEEQLDLSGWDRRSALRILQGRVTTLDRFEARIDRLREELDGPPDRRIARQFRKTLQRHGQIRRFRDLMVDVGRRTTLPADLADLAARLTGELRSVLAMSGVETLEPDLVILDEFQRFGHLLSVEKGQERAELAHHLFNYPAARVLLLSATPYKPYTFAEEGEDHHREFLELMRFLNDDSRWLADVSRALGAYREAAIAGKPVDDIVTEVGTAADGHVPYRATTAGRRQRHARRTGAPCGTGAGR